MCKNTKNQVLKIQKIYHRFFCVYVCGFKNRKIIDDVKVFDFRIYYL